MNIENYIKRTNRYLLDGRNRPRVICVDGFEMSVQASESHYCTPKQSKSNWYTSLEVGFPSKDEPLLLAFSGTNDSDIYGWVTLDIINKILEKHGGINKANTFK